MDKIISFFSRKNEYKSLSNFWENDVTVQTRQYQSGEHAFHGEKYTRLADLSSDRTRHENLLEYGKTFLKPSSYKTPSDAKKAGGKQGLLLFENELKLWEKISLQVQKEISKWKLETDKQVQDDLLKSGNKLLIHTAMRCNEEKATHCIWEGKGIIKDGKVVVLGQNLLGKIWMEFRKFLNIEKMNMEEYKKFLSEENIEDLHSLKLYLDDIYYNTGNSSISDIKYDMLKDTLIKRDKTYIPQVGAKLRDGENRVQLPYWLGSADKITFNQPDVLSRWKEKNPSDTYVVSEKLDGVSCLLSVKDEKMHLYTRGDGIIGADISYLSSYINIPKTKDMNVRGELIIKKKDFQEKYKEVYKNARNMVSGLLSSKTAKKGLEDIHFIAYEIVGDTMPRPEKQLKTLKNLGFETVNYEVINSISTDNLSEVLKNHKKTSEYELDGLVVQTNKPYDRNTSGNPDYMFAFKMTAEEDIHETIVNKVEWNMTKWGQLKPVVIVEPVNISGVTIQRVTAHNAKYVEDNKIGKNTVIKITRSNEVIPYIVEVVKGSEHAEMPDVEYKWDNTRVNISAVKYDNIVCVKLISGFFSQMGIKHVSEATVEKMFNNGLDNLLKIVSASKERLLEVPEFQEKSAERIYSNIRAGLKNVKISSVIGASGVLGFGIGSKRMDALFLDIPDLLTIYKKKSEKEVIELIIKVEGFSYIMASKIAKNLKHADDFIKKLSLYASFKKENRISDMLKGQKFVVSGFRDKKLEEDITQRGGKLVSSVSKTTTAVVVQSKSGKMTGKIEKASELEIPLYEKEEFIQQYIV